MSALIQYEVSLEVMADFRQFVLVEPDGLASLSPLIAAQPTQDIAFSGDGGVVFFCSHELAEPHVVFQQWSAEPSRQDDWMKAYTGDFRTSVRDVTLGCLTGAPSDITVRLPAVGAFGISVYWKTGSTGAGDTAREDWLIQVWPNRPGRMAGAV
ncbi:hypothetical protein [Actinokineospora sp. HUAS TT18]|uniref:hypothetical protein n=1 Tax=Actinokineospora sp. HUAS TT18 TaxID=3447451 RepID=UPI003F51EB9D